MNVLGAIAIAAGLAALGTAIAATLSDWGPSAARMFLWCLLWGFATGMTTGALTGLLVALFAGGFGGAAAAASWALVGVLIGGIVGTVVSIVPSVLGGLVVTGVIRRRHPQPASSNAVDSDLRRLFQLVLVVLDLALLLAVFARGDGLSSLVDAFPVIAAGNACVVLMMCRARGPIGRAWSETTA